MTASEDVGWDVCDVCAEEDGIGIRLSSGRKCWAHADDQDFESALTESVKRTWTLDARGVRLDAALLARLLAAAPLGAEKRPQLSEVLLDRATFTEPADFNRMQVGKEASFVRARFYSSCNLVGVRFDGGVNFRNTVFHDWAAFSSASFAWVSFSHTRFNGPAEFERAVFGGEAGFESATFTSIAGFLDATFHQHVGFHDTTFADSAGFPRVTFRNDAGFGGAKFKNEASFDEAVFERRGDFRGTRFFGSVSFARAAFQNEADFTQAVFRRSAGFTGTTFYKDAIFTGARVLRSADFTRAVFEQASQLGPMLVRDGITLDAATFKQRIQVEVSTNALYCRRTRFLDGGHLRVRWAFLILDDADFARPTIISKALPFRELPEGRTVRAWQRLSRTPRTDRPALLSVRRADVAALSVGNVDLEPCLFAGAHNLERLRIEADATFGQAPRGWRWTSRRVLAEERAWRSGKGWEEPAWPGWLERPVPLAPEQITQIYQTLRKGREDNKDEPGAADFYYGEMEMRRHAARRFSPEWWLLTLYWLVSGYALRAWRAFAALLLVIVVAAGIFAAVGFKPPEARRFVPVGVSSTGALVYQEQPVKRPSRRDQFPGALGYSAEVATSLLRTPERPVTAAGEWIQAILRWLGPLLFGLAIFSLRGRVKR